MKFKKFGKSSKFYIQKRIKKYILVFFYLSVSVTLSAIEFRVKEEIDYRDAYEPSVVYRNRCYYFQNTPLYKLPGNDTIYINNGKTERLFSTGEDGAFLKFDGYGYTKSLLQSSDNTTLYLYGYGWTEKKADDKILYELSINEDGQIVKTNSTNVLPDILHITNSFGTTFPFLMNYDYQLEIMFTKTGNRDFSITKNDITIFQCSDFFTDHYLYTIPAINNKQNELFLMLYDKTLISDMPLSDFPFKFIRLSIIYDAICNDTRVRIREEPNLSCNTYGFLNPGDEVKIIDRSDEPTEIDGESWYWYKIESNTLPDGWVYGKYLDIEDKLPTQELVSKSLQAKDPETPEEAYSSIVLSIDNATYNFWNFADGIYGINKMTVHTPNDNERDILKWAKYYIFVKGNYLCIYDWESKETDLFTGFKTPKMLGNTLLNYENLTEETECILISSRGDSWTLCADNGAPCLISRSSLFGDCRIGEVFISFEKDYTESYGIEYTIPFPWYAVSFQGYSTEDFSVKPDIVSEPEFDDMVNRNYTLKSLNEIEKWIVTINGRIVTEQGIFYTGIYEGKTIYIKEFHIIAPTLKELENSLGAAYLGA